ncbi:MAG: CHASE4 domain-containing protein [Methanomassiliicoccus sp.]|nr:CHASE4 domain-containing protein [Methanomassiliicoccus sp.]
MKLRSKTLLAVGAIMIVMMFAIVAITSDIVMQGAITHEKKDVDLALDSVSISIRSVESEMSRTAKDWAAWDATYEFIDSLDQSYLESNMDNETLSSLQMNYLLMFNNSRQLIYGQGYDNENAEPLNVSPGIIDVVLANIPEKAVDEPNDSFQGVVLTERGPLLIAVHSITDGSEALPVRGFLVMARQLDDAVIESISDIVKVHAEVFPANDSAGCDLDAATWNDVLHNGSVVVKPFNDTLVFGYQALPGINGSAVAVMKIVGERHSIAQGIESTNLIATDLVFVSLLFCAVTLVVTDRFTTRRIGRLSRQVKEIGKNGNTASHVNMDGSDELSDLAQEMNETIDALHSTKIALQEGERRYRAIVNDQTEMIFRMTEDGVVTFANQALLHDLRRSEAEVIGTKVQDLVPPEIFERLKARCEEAAMVEGALKIDHHSPRSSGDRWMSWIIRKIPVENGALEFQWVGRDLTEQKIAESALAMANKKLNLLASITRHDVMNKLTVAHGYVTIVRGQSSDTKVVEHLTKAEAALKSIEGYLDFTRDFQQMGLAAPVWLNLEEAIGEAAAGVRSDGIEVTVEVGDLEILTDPLVEKVFFNILDNAQRHGVKVTTIHIAAHIEEDGMLLTIEDNGAGIPQEEKELIFRAGYGKNTGYGLFLAREILSFSGMTLRETGEVGKGARFEISVPPTKYRHAPRFTLSSIEPTA